MTKLSAIEKVTISENDFYWGSAFHLSGVPSFKGLGTADPQSSPMGIYNGALICIIMNINEDDFDRNLWRGCLWYVCLSGKGWARGPLDPIGG